MHLQNFIKIHQWVHNLLSIYKILTSIKAIALLKMIEKYCSVIQIYILSISMHIQNLIEIQKLIHKILSINKILTLIKGHNSVKKWPNIMCIRYNMELVYISMHIKIWSKLIHLFWKYWGKTFLHQSRAITLLFIKAISSFAISNHSSLMSMSMQSLKKIGQKLLKLRVRKLSAGWWTDRRRDRYPNGLKGIT